MKKRLIDLSMGSIIRKLGVALATFIITFGVVSSITNAGNTYAAYTYKVTFEMQGGTLVINDVEMPNQTSTIISILDYSIYSANREGYTFKGWTDTGLCIEDDDIKTTGKQTLTADKTIWACYEKIPEYTVTFKLGGGVMVYDEHHYTSDTIITVLKGTKITTPSASKTNGVELDYWNLTGTDGSAISNLYPGGVSVTVNKDLIYTAIYKQSYSVTFNVGTNGIFYENGVAQARYDKTLSIVDYSNYTASRDGYVFNGWGTTSGCKSGNKTGTMSVTDATTLYACYITDSEEETPGNIEQIEDTIVQIYLNKNDGTEVIPTSKSCTITSGETSCKITDLPTDLE